MRTTFLFLFIASPLISFCQSTNNSEMALINDKDGFTFLRLAPDLESEILDTIFSYEFIEVDSKVENGWSKAHNRWGKSGYIHRSRIKKLNSLPDSQKRALIDSILTLEPLYYTKKLIWRNDTTGHKNFHEENFEAILGLFIEYQIKYYDEVLMRKFINILIQETASADAVS